MANRSFIVTTLFTLIFLFLGDNRNAFSLESKPSITETQEKLSQIISKRPERKLKRDKYRHPYEVLTFFGIEPYMKVMDIYPGGGWWDDILEPLLSTSSTGEHVKVRSSSQYPGIIKDSETNMDMILVFRAHGFLKFYKYPPQTYFDAFFKSLKPGGILGMVDHRRNRHLPADPLGESGYADEATVIKQAQNAGFILVAKSEVNANPKDNTDHVNGVFSLPPSLRGGDKDREKYLKIGESDRMTLKFMKPE